MQLDNNVRNTATTRGADSIVATHSVLRNTYLLLSLTLIFSAGCAGLSMAANAPYPGILVTLIGFYGLMFLTYKTSHSVWGLVSTFAFTGFVGYTLGPLLNMVMQGSSNGGQIIMTALGGTGLIFFALSGYVLTTRKDMSFMSGALVIGTVIGLLLMVGTIFLKIPGLYLAISAFFMLLSSGWILWQTSMIINGGERNYIMATVGLYVQLYNIFVSLLSILSAFSNRE
jgi:modulator of FtsH protease